MFGPKSHLHDKADPKYSNIIINNISTLVYPLNYAYLNNKLLNLNDLTADFHDNALFNNISLLKHNQQFSNYAQYLIRSLDLVSNSKDFSTQQITLNPWLKSTVEIILQLECNNSFNCEECLLDGLDEKNCKNLENFISKKNFFSIFFLDTLNGNFFKLDHLMAYIDKKISEIAIAIKIQNENCVNILDDFDTSPKSLSTLKQVRKFLTLPCTHKHLKVILIKQIIFKKLLLFNQYHSSNKTCKNIHLKLDNRFIKNDKRYENLNNNDETCMNFNHPR